MQGVSINIFIKTGKKKVDELGQSYHFDLLGKREFKYDFLKANSIMSIPYKLVLNTPPMFTMLNRNFKVEEEYNKGFKLNDLFNLNGNGIVSKRDELAFQFTKDKIKQIIKDFYELPCNELKVKFKNVSWESRDGKIEFVKNNVVEYGQREDLFTQCNYRPFDKRWTYYTGKSKGFIGWPVNQIMKHFLNLENLGLVIGRQGQVVGAMPWNLVFATKYITDFNVYYRGGGMIFPLYLYPETNGQQSITQTATRTPNLNPAIVKQIADNLGLTFTPEKETESEICFANSPNVRPEFKQSFAPIDLLDYIYAVLHSPTYREKYKEFLKIDFPRVPYPQEPDTFWQLVKLGSELRQIHLLERPTVENYITQYPVDGSNVVSKVKYQEGHVYINDTQYFANVPAVAWNFYIGGYQPAQKWLKDRKDRQLQFEDILHYQKIIVALSETNRIMAEIDNIEGLI